jgi:hypothetical protein
VFKKYFFTINTEILKNINSILFWLNTNEIFIYFLKEMMLMRDRERERERENKNGGI